MDVSLVIQRVKKGTEPSLHKKEITFAKILCSSKMQKKSQEFDVILYYEKIIKKIADPHVPPPYEWMLTKSNNDDDDVKTCSKSLKKISII